MNREKELAQKLLNSIKATQPKFTLDQNSISVTTTNQTVSFPIALSQVTRDRSISFR